MGHLKEKGHGPRQNIPCNIVFPAQYDIEVHCWPTTRPKAYITIQELNKPGWPMTKTREGIDDMTYQSRTERRTTLWPRMQSWSWDDCRPFRWLQWPTRMVQSFWKRGEKSHKDSFYHRRTKTSNADLYQIILGAVTYHARQGSSSCRMMTRIQWGFGCRHDGCGGIGQHRSCTLT